jgi:hypothetical protein
MKKRVCRIFIILFSAFFLVLSSGVVITIHECCHKHHHVKSDHKHCHEDKLFLKIKDEFTKSERSFVAFPLVETVLFSSIQLDNICIATPHFQNSTPPLLKLVGVNFINFTSQRVFYS